MFRTIDKRALAIVFSVVVSYKTYRALKNGSIRAKMSAVAELLSTEAEVDNDLVRDVFARTVMPEPHHIKGHTHPSAAALRNSATNFALGCASSLGVRPYFVGMSKSDQRRGLSGSRQWYWAKDTKIENRRDPSRPNDMIYMGDVDYYIDMPYFLNTTFNPILLYTHVPEEAAAESDDTAYHFDESGKLVVRVRGGGQYSHHIWDYACDSLVAKEHFWGIPIGTTSYAVERRQVGHSRQLVLLTPIKRWGILSAWLANFAIEGHELKRFDPVVKTRTGDTFIRFQVHGPNGLLWTTSRPNSTLCATVPARDDDAVATAARLGSATLQLPTVVSWLGKDTRHASAVLTDYHRNAVPRPLPTVYPVEESIRSYQFEPAKYDPEARPKLQPFMSPLVNGAFAPDNTSSSERRCVEGRINALKKPEPKPIKFVDECMREFADLVVGDAVLEPVCVETVLEKQTGHAQKLSLTRAFVSGKYTKPILKCFVKAEAYAGPKDPRNISQYNDKDKLEMAQFALALAAHCKQFPWYAPGKTPLEIATRVSEICKHSDFVNVSDYTRMDGTISHYLRQVERVVCMKAFTHHAASLNELLKRNVNNTGILPFGTTFKQESSHGSGCSATSVFQTLRASFTSYLGYRRLGRVPSDAFASIGIHLGDDGVDGDLTIAAHQWAAKKVGLVLESAVVPNGERGVNFLSRYYSSEVWYGRLDSMCDVKRQLSKLHTTVRLPENVSPAHKLVEKCRGYAATDSSTPVLGQFVSSALSFTPEESYRRSLGVASWWSKFKDSEQYPNGNEDGWMDAEFDIQFPEFDRDRFTDWLHTVSSLQEHLHPPLCVEVERPNPPAVEVVVDGDILAPEEPPSATKEPTATLARLPRQRRTRRRKGKAECKPQETPPSEGRGKNRDGAGAKKQRSRPRKVSSRSSEI
uniref:RNA replicase n=1 Tax=Beihai noda-like virus 3 TaxID=1922484 RepID=A0A1L3KFP5_9VIRU|nr:hypothetical protein 1 [Beihai noda-like virus 3]